MLISTFCPHAGERYSINGSIYTALKGPVYIYLVDEATFKTPMSGLKKMIMYPDKNGIINYNISYIKAGVYGIRCFQDLNGNNILDRGAFGPSEPWGMSWQSKRIGKWPSFSNISFSLTQNVKLKTINLE
jgi:hypothetical protein